MTGRGEFQCPRCGLPSARGVDVLLGDCDRCRGWAAGPVRRPAVTDREAERSWWFWRGPVLLLVSQSGLVAVAWWQAGELAGVVTGLLSCLSAVLAFWLGVLFKRASDAHPPR